MSTVLKYIPGLFQDSGSSPEMNIDGSVTPVEFEIRPASNELFIVDKIGILIITNNKVDDIEEFANLPALTNGIGSTTSLRGTATTNNSINSNADIFSLFNNSLFEPFDNPMKILNSSYDIPDGSLKLSGATGDFMRFTVRDDLRGLEKLRFAAHFYVREVV